MAPQFVSPSLDWLAWLGLASLASAWLVSSAAATTTATTPEEAATTTAAARSAATVVIAASSGVVAVVVAAADETSHAEARLAKPSQASQSREGLTNCGSLLALGGSPSLAFFSPHGANN